MSLDRGGEWLKYSIKAVADGLYTLQGRVHQRANGRNISVEFDGVDKTGPMTDSDSGGWQTGRT